MHVKSTYNKGKGYVRILYAFFGCRKGKRVRRVDEVEDMRSHETVKIAEGSIAER